MHKKKSRLHRNSIGQKLFLYTICIILLPTVILSFIIQLSYQNSVMDLARDNVARSVELINYNITNQFEEYRNLAYFVSKDKQFREIGNIADVDLFFQNEEGVKRIQDLLYFHKNTVSDVHEITVMYDNGVMISSNRDFVEIQDPIQQTWYAESKENPSVTYVWTYDPMEPIYFGIDPINVSLISVCASIFDLEGDFVGVINVSMYNNVISRSLANILNSDGSYVYIVDSQEKVVYSPVVQTVLDIHNPSQYVSVTRYNEENSWEVVGVVPVTEYLEQIDFLSRVLLVSMFCIAVIMIILSVNMRRSVVRPIANLRTLMDKASHGDLSVRFLESKLEEIRELGENFNVMIEKLDLLIKQVYEVQRGKRKAEILALQANIKPHFLYNTLDTIHWMALNYKATDIMETVDMLATLFRISLSKGSETIEVSQELTHVTSYLHIQKVRYEDMIDYSINVSPECKDFYVQKLILQPLVENAIYHGIKESKRKGKISIDIWKEENVLYLCVKDNGMGIPEKRLQRVRESLENFKPEKDGAYGIVNVHQRISLSYGSEYGVIIDSVEGMGTTSTICHPILLEEMDDKSIDS